MSKTWIERETLSSERIRMEPLDLRHAVDLAEACDDRMFDFFPVYPEPLTVEGLTAYISRRNLARATVPLAAIDAGTGRAIASSSFFEISAENLSVEIGHTWIAKQFRATHVNPEMKLLMMRYAFESCGVNRVQFRTDMRNLQSQAAIKKLGAKQEGVFRKHMVMPDGHLRDTVFYSVTCDEWPSVRDDLQRRLDAFR